MVAIPLTLDSLFLHLHLLVASFYYPQNKHFLRVERIQKFPFMQIQLITLVYKTSHITEFQNLFTMKPYHNMIHTVDVL